MSAPSAFPDQGDPFDSPGDFDPDRYLRAYPDVARLGMDPGEHYRWIGRGLGRDPQGDGEGVVAGPGVPPFCGFGPLRHAPLVSVLVVGCDSGVALARLLATIAAQTYRATEVVVIETGTQDTRSLCTAYAMRTIWQSAPGLCFVAAANRGWAAATGELLLLVQPDAELEPEVVARLLDGLRCDEMAAAVAPRILYRPPAGDGAPPPAMVVSAGCELLSDGRLHDRGRGGGDAQVCFDAGRIGAISARAAMIRRSAMAGRLLFADACPPDRAAAGLSGWLTGQGFRLCYQPAARVWLGDFDPATAADPTSPGSLLIPPRAERPVACVYDSYMSSMGGGERHAITVASQLRSTHDVWLAAETDFDMAALEDYFGVDLGGVRKLVCGTIDAGFTARFDVFVNATFHSNLVSRAADSVYLVSFPHADADPRILSAYRFLHNSAFTERWARRYWGPHRHEVLLPVLGMRIPANGQHGAKSRSILAVGRFTSDGHCKNHHLILRAFRELIRRDRRLAGWSLTLAGSYDPEQPQAVAYLAELRALAAAGSVTVMADADLPSLQRAYRDAALYAHATGLDVPADEPERHEHFGISVFEAMSNGCVPIVYALGGPAEQVAGLREARCFRDREELMSEMLSAMRRFDRGENDTAACAEYARAVQQRNDARQMIAIACPSLPSDDARLA